MTKKVCELQAGHQSVPGERPEVERVNDFEETTHGYTEKEAYLAAQRCLSGYECTYCEVCQLMCPDLCITRDEQSGHINIDLEHCKGCGLCAHYCPKGAISMELEKSD